MHTYIKFKKPIYFLDCPESETYKIEILIQSFENAIDFIWNES